MVFSHVDHRLEVEAKVTFNRFSLFRITLIVLQSEGLIQYRGDLSGHLESLIGLLPPLPLNPQPKSSR